MNPIFGGVVPNRSRLGIAVSICLALTLILALGWGGSAHAASKVRLTVAYGSSGSVVKVTGSVSRTGVPKGKRVGLVLLEERVRKGKRVRWVVRSRVAVRSKGRASTRFRLRWKAPKRSGAATLRTRVVRGAKQLARGKARTFRFGSRPALSPKVTVPAAADVISAPDPAAAGVVILKGKRSLAPGEVIAAAVGPGTPNGFLGQVVSSRGERGRTRVKTRPISLMEAVPNSSFDVSGTDLVPDESLTPRQKAIAAALTGGTAVDPRVLAQAGPATAQSGGRIGTGKKRSTCGPADLFKVGSDLSGSVDTRFSMDWRNALGVPVSVKSARAEATFRLNHDLEISSAAGVKCSKSISLLPKKLRFKPITFKVGPVPVTLVPELDIKLRFSGDLKGKAALTVDSELRVRGGIDYRNGRSAPISDVTRSSSPSLAHSPGEGTAEATVGPVLSLKLYGGQGPEISARAGIAGAARKGRSPWFTLDGTVNVSARIEMKLPKLSFEASATAADVNWPILRIEDDPEEPGPVDPEEPVDPDDGEHLKADTIDSGWNHTCAIRPSGQAVCWGENSHGQLGDGTTVNRYVPTPVAGLTDAVAISAGGGHSCAVRTSGQAVCWGYGSSGQLGSFSSDTKRPQPVEGLSDVESIGTGHFHTCARLRDGEVHCWGDNRYGQIGDGSDSTRWEPTEVASLGTASSLAVGTWNTCAIRESGQAFCWGANHHGQVGDGTTTDRGVPTPVHGLSDAKSVSAGGDGACGIRGSGEVVCWGENSYGQVGDGTRTGWEGGAWVNRSRHTPVVVQGIDGASEVTAGTSHNCAIRATGDAMCWGANSWGTIGDGTFTGTQPDGHGMNNDRTRATGVSGLEEVRAITAGGRQTCAIDANGLAHCWGYNYYGQIGDGTFTGWQADGEYGINDRYLPTPVLRGS